MKLVVFVLSGLVSLSTLAQNSKISVSDVAPTAPESTGRLPDAPPAGETTIKIKEALKNKEFEDKHEITDAKLRAEAGSLSKYSLRFNLSYYGPPVGDLEAKDQPNPDRTNSPKETAISGSFGGRYRIDPRRTISVGTGLKAVYPFHGMERMDLNDPSVSYDISSRIAGIQFRTSPGVTYVTTPNYVRTGEYGSLDFRQSVVYDLGTSGVAIALDGTFGYYLYNREYQRGDGKANRYSISLYPAIKYNFNDKLNFNTSTKLGWWNPRQNDNNETELLNSTISQSVSMGYAFTRDVYLSPAVTFYPNRLALDVTTVNLSAIFSIM